MILLGIGILCVLNTVRVAAALNSGDQERMKAVSGMEGRWPTVVLLILSILAAAAALGGPYIYEMMNPSGR